MIRIQIDGIPSKEELAELVNIMERFKARGYTKFLLFLKTPEGQQIFIDSHDLLEELHKRVIEHWKSLYDPNKGLGDREEEC